MQLQELGKENKSPIFSEPLLDEVTVKPGRMRRIQLPRITDPEKDEVKVSVRVNGGSPLTADGNDCGDDPCYVHFLLDRMLIEIYYPSNYLSSRDDSSQSNASSKDEFHPHQRSAAISVPVFDENGQLQMIEKDSSDTFDRNSPRNSLDDDLDNDSGISREKNFIEILLDDGSSISTYRVEVIVINIGGGSTILPNDLDTDTNNLIIEPNDQIQSQVQEEESNGDVIEISKDEFEFDFLEWLDVQEVRA